MSPRPWNATLPVEFGGQGGTGSDLVAPRTLKAEPVAKPDHFGKLTLSAVPSGDEVKSENVTMDPDAASDIPVSAVQPEVPRLSASGTESSASARLAEGASAPVVEPAIPADQVTPALVGLLKTTDGSQSLTVHLQPSELGQVQIRIDRTGGGATHVAITTETPETLALLQRDQPRLGQALEQAGVPLMGRNITFQLTPVVQIAGSAFRTDGMAAGSGNAGQDQSGGAWRQSSDQRRDPDAAPDQRQARTRWFRAGLDITA
jgi:hypothetical protein